MWAVLKETTFLWPGGSPLTSLVWELIASFLPRRQWHPTPVLLPGKSHGWRSLVGCSPWGGGGSDTTEQLHFHFSLSCIGEGNGNPLQCSCLENPRDGGAWWAAVYEVTQSQTWLKQLSSSSSSSCSMSSSNCCFLTCIQISQEAGQVVWYSHLLKNFPQFVVIHTVKSFGIVNKVEIDIFLELFCFSMLTIWSLVPLPFLNPASTSGSSWFMYCWNLAWRILIIALLALST